MPKKTVSAKGVVVDFDLMKIKEQMAEVPVTVDVQKRRDFIESRLRRRTKKKLPTEPTPQSTKDVEVEPEIAKVEEAAPMIEEPVVEEKKEEKAAPKKKTTKKKTTRKKTTQRARPTPKTEEPSEDETE